MKKGFSKKDNGFGFEWDNKKVWDLDLPVEEVGIEELEWILDVPIWDEGEIPRNIMENMDNFPEHRDRIINADISFPIDIMLNNQNRWLTIDGLHRYVKLVLEGERRMKVRRIPKSVIHLIKKDN